MKLSVVIPCYNEAGNIPLLLESYSKEVAGKDIEVIFVDNNSSDNTSEILAELIPKYPFSRTVFEPRPGYGSAIAAGLKISAGEYAGWTHGDMQTPPKNIAQALSIIESLGFRKDIYIKGKRYGRPLFDRFFTFGMSIFETLYLGYWLNDINAQPNIFHRSFLENLQNVPTDFSFDLFAFYEAKKHGLTIIRFDVEFLKRMHGVSAWNTGIMSRIKFIKRTLSFSKQLKKSMGTLQ